MQYELTHITQNPDKLLDCNTNTRYNSILSIRITRTLKTQDGKSTESFRVLQKFIRTKQLGDLTIE